MTPAPNEDDAPAPAGGSVDDSANSLLREAAELSEPPSGIVAGPLPGDVLSNRFVIEGRMASGGMGAIYRAVDSRTDERVAIKVMAGRLSNRNRFAQETEVLSALSHPAVVRYVAHGATPDARPYLAMEWLDGEDLAQRLARAPLTVEESVSIVRHACEGIAAAHARGVVHRDIKPSNLFLVDREPSSLKVIDFGVARVNEETRTLTRPGALLGTVGYMSPEQAMGARNVDARTDVFALGCVLFECLTGRPAFVGRNAVAVLAKVLREDPPRVSELRSGLGDALDALLGRLLAKQPEERPRDAAAVLSELNELGLSPIGEYARMPPAGVTAAELTVVSVILGRPANEQSPPARFEGSDEPDVEGLRESTRRFGGELVAIRGGGVLAVLSARGAATDRATHAARCALLLSALRPDLCFAVATGRAETTGPIPVGAAIDRAAELLSESRDPACGVGIDDLTRGLLEPGFEVDHRNGRLVLLGELPDAEPNRLLMGKRTPFVGREKELSLLELTLEECVEASVARAVLVTGPPGQGKSRLRSEFIARVRDRGDTRIWIARADAMGAGSSFQFVRQLVRQAVGLREGGVSADPRAKLQSHVEGVCSKDADRIADFLAELVGVPPVIAPSVEFRAARGDPQIMSVWMRRSFGEWLSAECSTHPHLVVLEDLHWGDLPSVTYLGEALRALATKPFLLLALARPEVHETFPMLFAPAEKQEIALGRLTPRAATRLVREALDDQLDEERVSRIVARADGNAFYLEELIRRAAGGDSETLPETVISLVQSRLDRLETEARRVVRAASVFGEAFHEGGVASLLRVAADDAALGGIFQSLMAHEVIAPSDDPYVSAGRPVPTLGHPGYRSRWYAPSVSSGLAANSPGPARPRGQRYSFRHDLLREAAYAMLTDVDRINGHRLAGEWLEATGDLDALALANHFEYGAAPDRAIPWLTFAARQGFDGGDLRATIALTDRAMRCGAEGEQRGAIGVLSAAALAEGGDLARAVTVGREAMGLLAPGSEAWLVCAANLFTTGTFMGDQTVTAPVLQAILTAPVPVEPTGPYLWAVSVTSSALVAVGALELARSTLERTEVLQGALKGDDVLFIACLRFARAYLHFVTGELANGVAALAEARAMADRTKLTTEQALCRYLRVAANAELGDWEGVEEAAKELCAFCEPRGLRFFSERRATFLAMASLNTRRIDDAIAELRTLVDRPDRQLAISARATLAHALIAAGDLESAAREASTALEDAAAFPASRPTALGALSLIALKGGRLSDALELADRGLNSRSTGLWPRDESLLRLARIEALHGLGRIEDARAALRDARDRILSIDATLVEARSTYTTRVAANARTLALANERLGDAEL